MTTGTSGWEYIGSQGFTPGSVDDIRLALDSNDAPWVVYQNGGNLWVMKYTGVGTTGWEYAGRSSAIVSSAYDISIAIDSADVVYIAFKNNANNGKATVMKHYGDLLPIHGKRWAQQGSLHAAAVHITPILPLTKMMFPMSYFKVIVMTVQW
jgi:hypothetical protein